MSKLCWFGVCTIVAAMLIGVVLAGDLTPPGPPGSTMKTLQEIYDKQDATHQLVEAIATPQMLSATTTVVNAGYYLATDLTIVEPDLTAENIKSGVTIFGVTGTHGGEGIGNTYNAAVPRTGQKTTAPMDPAPSGSDGDLLRGVAWPDPRFTDHGDWTVTDNLTGLMWMKSGNFFGGNFPWATAIEYCDNLEHGGYTDWRLPNLRELQSLLDYSRFGLMLPDGHPFIDVLLGSYWSSSTFAANTNEAWIVLLDYGNVVPSHKSTGYLVWPVRGGE